MKPNVVRPCAQAALAISCNCLLYTSVDLMNGPIFKSLFIFMLPIFVSNLFQQLYNTVDTMIVGNCLLYTSCALSTVWRTSS